MLQNASGKTKLLTVIYDCRRALQDLMILNVFDISLIPRNNFLVSLISLSFALFLSSSSVSNKFVSLKLVTQKIFQNKKCTQRSIDNRERNLIYICLFWRKKIRNFVIYSSNSLVTLFVSRRICISLDAMKQKKIRKP